MGWKITALKLTYRLSFYGIYFNRIPISFWWRIEVFSMFYDQETVTFWLETDLPISFWKYR